MEKTKTSQKLVECAILVAMAFVLSFITIIRMPFGGAVTAASMLPIIIAGYRNGLKWGLLSGFAYSVLQLITGVANVSYATSAAAAVAIIMLDYIVAFTVLGLVGIFKRNKHQTLVLILGTLVVCALRFVCHFITGCTVWAGVSIPSSDGMLYSLVYNGAYMIPETVVTVYVAALISNSLDLRKDMPAVRQKTKGVTSILNGVLVLGIALIIDFLYIFRVIQGEDGFDITGIKNANGGTIAIITIVGAVLGIVVYFISDRVIKKKNSKQ